MGGLTSLLNKQPTPNGTIPRSKSVPVQWPHFFVKQAIPSAYYNSTTLLPDMNGKWFDNTTLRIPLNSGFVMSLNTKTSSPNSALAKSVVMKVQDVPLMPAIGVDECGYDNKDTPSSPPTPVATQTYELKYDLFGLVCGYEDMRIAHIVDEMLIDTIHCKISEVKEDLSLAFLASSEWIQLKHEPFACCQTERILVEEVVVGAIEQSFYEVDMVVGNNWHTYGLTGGCSVIICLLINNCLYVANVGKCRAYLHSPNKPCVSISTDSTPDYDRQRIQAIAYLQEQLLTPEYTRLQFEDTLREEHRGRRVLYRDKHMTGWAFKLVTGEDIDKVPIVTGVGDKSRLFGLDIPTRGVGFYGKKAPGSIPFKPFITCIPEITSTPLKDLSKGDSLVLTSPDCSKYINCEVIQGVMNKGIGNGTDPRHQDTGTSQVQAFKILSLTNQIANSSNLERHIVNVDDQLLEDSSTHAHDLALSCMVIPLPVK